MILYLLPRVKRYNGSWLTPATPDTPGVATPEAAQIVAIIGQPGPEGDVGPPGSFPAIYLLPAAP